MISKEDIDKILDAVHIEDVVGDFVELKKRGVNYIGLCPFHNEKTPSFNVNPTRNIFKCFGCGEGGDSISFLMKYQHFTYPEALRYLANKYGIEIKEEAPSKEEIQQRDEQDALFAVNEFACKYFQNNLLNTDEGKSIGLSYFNEREITQKTIDTWRLGYSKQKSNDFAQYALRSGYTEDILIKSGLCIKSDKDGSLFDRFHSRITFPIYNVGGRVIGFSCRILTNDKTKAKYVNSPESPIYTKGKNLFGLNFARNEIAKQDCCYLVEGNVDAVMMSQNDVKNVVASNGTALTENQVHLIRRYTSNITILYDGDAAGIHAAIRATDMFLKEGMHVSIVLFPDGNDPDSYARKHTQDEFQQFLKTNAQNFITYRCNLAATQTANDPIKRAELVKEIVHSISLIPDTLERFTYIQQCSNLLNISESVLNDQLQKEIIHNAYINNKQEQREQQSKNALSTPKTNEQKNETTPFDIPKQEIVSNKNEHLERNLIKALISYQDKNTNQLVIGENGKEFYESFNAASYIVNSLLQSDIHLKNPLYQEIFSIYKNAIDEQRLPSPAEFYRNPNGEIGNFVSGVLNSKDEKKVSDLWSERGLAPSDPNSQRLIDQDIKTVVLSLNLQKLNDMLKEIELQMAENKDDESLIHTYADFMRLRNKIAKELNRTTL